jgi:glycosyltransferase involved in cell wall biosynthesis
VNVRAPVNIALVVDTLYRAGAERMVVDIANSLDPERFRSHVIATRNRGELATELEGHVEMHSLERKHRWDLDAFRRFNAIIATRDIRLVHTHNHTVSYFARVARSLAGAKWPQIIHDHHGPVEASRTLRLLDRVFLPRVDYYFGVSERLCGYARRALGIPAERIRLIRNGVHVPADTPRRPATPFTIVQVGRVIPVKNQLLALQMAVALRALVPDFRWLFVGGFTDPVYARKCQERARELGLEQCVRFLGARPDVAELLRTAHVGVLTSTYEGLPVALLEYMAAGLPAVVTDVGQCPTVLNESRGGWIVKQQDVSGFAAALAGLAQDAALAAEAGERNRRFVAREYSVSEMTKRVAEVYDLLLSHPSSLPLEPRTRVLPEGEPMIAVREGQA